MSPRFKIEAVEMDGSNAYVRATQVGSDSFAVSEGSTLGGVAVHAELEEPAPGTFLFHLIDAAERSGLKAGKVVALET